MKDLNHTMLEAIQYILSQHPNLAPAVEELALISQGKDQASLRRKREAQLFQGLDTRQIFTKIYTERLWGHSGRPEDVFWSGTGSHIGAIVQPYVQAVAEFLAALGGKPSVVDLGCGDFSVGAQLRPLCGSYVACDIVAPLIEHNQRQFAALDVDFRLLDICSEALPSGDVVFVRQVLQHLSNAEIANVVRQIEQNFKYLVLTEHLPADPGFTPNVDKPTGRDIRMGIGSGVVLTAAPFQLRAVAEQLVCEAAADGGIIRSTLYRLA